MNKRRVERLQRKSTGLQRFLVNQGVTRIFMMLVPTKSRCFIAVMSIRSGNCYDSTEKCHPVLAGEVLGHR